MPRAEREAEGGRGNILPYLIANWTVRAFAPVHCGRKEDDPGLSLSAQGPHALCSAGRSEGIFLAFI